MTFFVRGCESLKEFKQKGEREKERKKRPCAWRRVRYFKQNTGVSKTGKWTPEKNRNTGSSITEQSKFFAGS